MRGRLLVRGRILTLDPARPDASSVLIENGVVADLDIDGDLDAQVISLDDTESLQPGYLDDHVHLLATAAARMSIDVSAVDSIDQLLAIVGSHSGSGEGWLRVWGYDDALLSDLRHPSRGELDVVTAGRPTVLHHRSGHVAVLNSAALDALGDGPRDGVLVEDHELLAGVPRLGADRLAMSARAVLDDMAVRGVVRCTDTTHTNDAAALEFLAQLCHGGGPDLVAMVGAECIGSLEGRGPGESVDGVLIGHAKVMPDVTDDESLIPRMQAARGAGFPVAVHVMDVDTLHVTLDALGEAPSGSDRIEHCALALPEQLDRIAADGHAVCTQPSFVTRRETKYSAQLSAVEQTWLWPLRSLTERGIPTTFGSDSPVVPSDPAEWIDAAVRRTIGPEEIVDEDAARQIAAVGAIARGAQARDFVIGGPDGFRRLDA